jgi:hypothetical protein
MFQRYFTIVTGRRTATGKHIGVRAISVRSGGADPRSRCGPPRRDGRSLLTGWKPCPRIRVLRPSLPSKGVTDTLRNIDQSAIQLERTHRRMHDSTNEVRMAIEWHGVQINDESGARHRIRRTSGRRESREHRVAFAIAPAGAPRSDVDSARTRTRSRASCA